MRISIIFLFFILFLNNTLANTRWPEFIAPDKTFLLSHGFIDTASCPSGSGKLIQSAVINIRDDLCKTFCPGYWHWMGSSTGECYDLTTQFEFQRYEIQSITDADGVINYTIITALYGDNKQETYSFALTIMTVAGEHWLCSKVHAATNAIMCTNDI